MSTQPDTSEAVAKDLGSFVQPASKLCNQDHHRADRKALAEAGYVVAPVVKVAVYGMDGLYNLATDPDTGPENFEADSMMFWVIERLQSLGVSIDLETEQ